MVYELSKKKLTNYANNNKRWMVEVFEVYEITNFMFVYKT